MLDEERGARLLNPRVVALCVRPGWGVFLDFTPWNTAGRTDVRRP